MVGMVGRHAGCVQRCTQGVYNRVYLGVCTVVVYTWVYHGVCRECSRLRRELSPLCTPSAQRALSSLYTVCAECIPVCTPSAQSVCPACTPSAQSVYPSSRLRRVYSVFPSAKSVLPSSLLRRELPALCAKRNMRDVHNGAHAGCAQR